MPTTPTQIRIPPDLLARIDATAETEGLTRTAWLLKAAQAQLEPTPVVGVTVAKGTVKSSGPSVRYRCPRGCGHEALSPVRCNFCKAVLEPI